MLKPILLKAKGHKTIILKLRRLSFSSEIRCSKLRKHSSTSSHFCRVCSVEACNGRERMASR